MALVDADPAAGALYVRDKLFEGVDEVGNLPGQTLTGGRINAGSSMQLIMNNCGACPGAYALGATSPELATSILSWNSPTASTFAGGTLPAAVTCPVKKRPKLLPASITAR